MGNFFARLRHNLPSILKNGLIIVVIIGISATVIYFSKVSQQKQDVKKSFAVEGPYNAIVTIDGATQKPISKNIWGVGDITWTSPAASLTSAINNYNMEKARELGIELIRYGWDTTDWNVKTIDGRNVISRPTNITTTYGIPIDEAISFAKSISSSTDILFSARVFSKVNTATSIGVVPLYPGKPTETENRDILLIDLGNALATRTGSIRQVELGNEEWSAYTIDEYISLANSFANKVKSIDPLIQVGLVGYPTSGNNMNPEGSSLDSNWSTGINNHKNDMCGATKCYDFVTDHPYFYHGYSNPTDWQISSPQYEGSNVLPSYQFRSVSFLSSDGTKLYRRICPVNYAKGKMGGLECNDFQPYDLNNLRGVGNESYIGISEFTYFQGSQQYRRLVVIDKQNPNQQYHQSCKINPDSWADPPPLISDCTSWYNVDLSAIIPTGFITDANHITDNDYLLFVDNSNSNKQKIRQRFANGTDKIEERTCDFVNGAIVINNDCNWVQVASPINGGSISGIESTRYYGVQYELGSQPIRQFVHERYLSTDQKTIYFRDCIVTNGAVDCSVPDVTLMKSVTINSLPGIIDDISTISAPGDNVFFLNNNNQDKFPNNFPGIGSYYTAKEAYDMFDGRIKDYSPLTLAITEWNFKCWGWHHSQKNISTKTVDQGLYTAEMLLQMAKAGVMEAIFWAYNEQSNASAYPGCSLFDSQNNTSADFNAAGHAFSLTSVLKGSTLLNTSTSGAPTFFVPLNKNCTGAGCLVGGYTISKLSSYAGLSSDQTKLYIFLINRSESTGTITVKLAENIPNYSTFNTYNKRTLNGISFTNTDFTVLPDQSNSFVNGMSVEVPPVSIVRLELYPTKTLVSQVPTATLTGAQTPVPTKTPAPAAPTVAPISTPVPTLTRTRFPKNLTPTLLPKPSDKLAPSIIY